MVYVRGLLDRLGLVADGPSPSPCPHAERVRLVMLAGATVEGLGLAQPALTAQIYSGLRTLLAYDLETMTTTTTINNNNNNDAHPPPSDPYSTLALTHAASLALAQLALATLPTAECDENDAGA